MEFSNYLSQKRAEKRIPIRKFAAAIGISPSFLCDLESGARAFPAKSKFPDLLEKMIAALELNEEDAELFRSLVEQSMLRGDKVSPEISAYLKRVPEAAVALRKANENNVSKEQWEVIIKILEEKK
ncbi:MAG: helix-turn-helix transcriptional regulator [Bacilli bacterium]|nr:helix-turn-helix transcriptional regulator [Bacilli bacterium]